MIRHSSSKKKCTSSLQPLMTQNSDLLSSKYSVYSLLISFGTSISCSVTSLFRTKIRFIMVLSLNLHALHSQIPEFWVHSTHSLFSLSINPISPFLTCSFQLYQFNFLFIISFYFLLHVLVLQLFAVDFVNLCFLFFSS